MRKIRVLQYLSNSKLIRHVTVLTRRHRYVHLCPRFSTPLLHSAPVNAAHRPFVSGHVRMQHTASSEDPRPGTLPVPLRRCSPHSCDDIQSTELSLQLACLHSQQCQQLSTKKSTVLVDCNCLTLIHHVKTVLIIVLTKRHSLQTHAILLLPVA